MEHCRLNLTDAIIKAISEVDPFIGQKLSSSYEVTISVNELVNCKTCNGKGKILTSLGKELVSIIVSKLKLTDVKIL